MLDSTRCFTKVLTGDLRVAPNCSSADHSQDDLVSCTEALQRFLVREPVNEQQKNSLSSFFFSSSALKGAEEVDEGGIS